MSKNTKAEMMINILLLNWNSSEECIDCINNILKSSYENYRIILIDNYSDINDRNRLTIFAKQIKTAEIHLVFNNDNLGYAEGNNKGYEYIKNHSLKGDILILNPDIVVQENTLQEMKSCLYQDNLIGGVMVRTKDFESKNILYDYIKMNGLCQKHLKTSKNIIETDYLAGSCMLLKRDVIDRIDLFDKKFFMYWEEVDLSFRIKRLGYSLMSTTKTFVFRKSNDKSRSLNMNYYMNRNAFLIYKKYKNRKFFYTLLLFLLKRFKGALIDSIKEKNLAYLITYYKGIFDGIKF